MIKCIDTTAQTELVRSPDAREDGKQRACDPVSDRVSEEVNLLTSALLGPEAYTSQKERPLIW